jgi:hypothetical protein
MDGIEHLWGWDEHEEEHDAGFAHVKEEEEERSRAAEMMAGRRAGYVMIYALGRRRCWLLEGSRLSAGWDC